MTQEGIRKKYLGMLNRRRSEIAPIEKQVQGIESKYQRKLDKLREQCPHENQEGDTDDVISCYDCGKVLYVHP